MAANAEHYARLRPRQGRAIRHVAAGRGTPEGIDVDREGNVYVVTVGANKPETSPGTLIVSDPHGKHLRTVRIEGSSPWLLDLGFNPKTGKLLVVDYRTRTSSPSIPIRALPLFS